MTKDELLERLKGYEWSDVEFKKAQRGVPEDAYKTVSAFSNTSGGWLVFGVQDTHGVYEIVGVIEVDKVQNDFLSALRSRNKFNQIISADEHLIKHGDNTVLGFYIPEARRNDKPIYLNNDFRNTFIRRGAGDEQCTPEELKRFIRDSSSERYDGQLIEELDAEHCFDEETVAWYRKIFHQNNPGKGETLSHVEFLHEWGFAVEAGDKLVPTRAGILVFGNGPALRQIIQRPLVDYQYILSNFEQWTSEQRWADRYVAEENLIQTWRTLLTKYMKTAEKPFFVDPANLRRQDDPPDYISFREATINLLIHQDFRDQTRLPVIQFFLDRTIFWNPGDAFVPTEQLFEPTTKEVRNQGIVNAFRRIGLSDQAGTGIRSIFSNWQNLGNIPPALDNNKVEKSFQLTLLKELLLSEEQLLLQAHLGVRLDEPEAKTFAYLCRKGTLNITDVKAVTGLVGKRAKEIVDRLILQVLLKPIDGSTELFTLADHLKGRFSTLLPTEQLLEKTFPSDMYTAQLNQLVHPIESAQVQSIPPDLCTAQVQPLRSISETQWRIISMCDMPQPLSNIMQALGISHRGFFMRRHLGPLIEGGIIKLTKPENPTASTQKYVVSEIGIEFKARRLAIENRGE